MQHPLTRIGIALTVAALLLLILLVRLGAPDPSAHAAHRWLGNPPFDMDWVGTSGYNAGRQATWDPQPPCRTFDDLFSPILDNLAARYPAKPQIVAEFATACDNGCDQALWITEAYYDALFYPRLRALVWFHVAKREGIGAQRQWIDWRIDCGGACPDCAVAYAQALASPRYSAAAPCAVRQVYLPLALKGFRSAP